MDVLTNTQSWEAIKRVLKTKEVSIESLRELIGLTAVSSLKPEAIPVEVKVIMVGSSYIYNILYEYDEDFKKLFKIRADLIRDVTTSKMLKCLPDLYALLSRENGTF